MTKQELFNNLKCPSVGSRIHLVTHNDLDGAAPGIILKSIYGEDNVTVTSVGNNYMSNTIERAVTDNYLSHDYDFVMVCDISCDEAAAERINVLSGLDNFVLLDHHKTADNLNKYSWAVVCSPMPDDSFRRALVPDNAPSDKVCSSGTSLLYDFLDEKGVLDEAHSANYDHLRNLTHVVATYDTWMWKNVYTNAEECRDLNELFYIYGREEFERNMLDYVMSDGDIPLIGSFDRKLLDIEHRRMKDSVDKISKGFKTGTIKLPDRDYSAVFVTNSQFILAVFERMQIDYPDKDLYVMNCGYSLSFRALKDDVDVSAIAASLGGGGHKGAAGVPISFDEQVGLMANVMNIPSHAITIDEPVLSAMPLRTVRKDGIVEKHTSDVQDTPVDKSVSFSL